MDIIANWEMLNRVLNEYEISISDIPESFITAILISGNERALRDFCCGRNISTSEVHFGPINAGWNSPFPVNPDKLVENFCNELVVDA